MLDAGALIAADKGDRRFWTFWKAALRKGLDVWVPATALAQAWRGSGSARIALVLHACDVEGLNEGAARATGELCGRTSTRDIVDADVILRAHAHRADVLTTDPDDLERLAGTFSPAPKILDLRKLP